MTCWICGSSADSREHKIKKSDLKNLLEKSPTQNSPIYIHTALRKNQPVASLNAKALKYAPSLCTYCNSTRTQPHDFAWQRLAESLCSNNLPLGTMQHVRTNRIFPYDTRRAMRHAHLYLVKVFGCQIVEGKVAGIDLSSFAQAIMSDRIHPNVYAAFGPAPRSSSEDRVIASGSDLHTAVLPDGRCAFATWIHHVGRVWVQIIFALDGEHRQGLVDAWNPKYGTTRLHMVPFNS